MGGIEVSSRAGRDGGSRVTFADLLTIANGLCGLGVVLVAAGLLRSGRHAVDLNRATLVACGALLAAGTLFDVLDGAAAARWGSSGRGEKLDAMCDVITFAAAPAILLVASQNAGSAVAKLAGILAGVILLGSSLLRLSQSGADHHRGTYPGLTMPGAASAVVALLFLHAGAAVLLAGTVAVSALLLSRVPYPAFGPRVAPLLVSVWVLGVLGLTGVLPMWPFAILMLACLPLAPILARRSRDGVLPRRLRRHDSRCSRHTERGHAGAHTIAHADRWLDAGRHDHCNTRAEPNHPDPLAPGHTVPDPPVGHDPPHRESRDLRQLELSVGRLY